MKPPAQPTPRQQIDSTRRLNLTAKGTPRLSASSGSIERPVLPPKLPKK